MRGDVGLSRIFQGIGKTVAGDGLKGIAGVAAHVAVIDDQRRAILLAHAACDLHDLGIGPPFEHRAGRSGAYQGRQQYFETRRRLGGGAEYQLAVAVEIDHALMPAGLAFHHLVDRQHVEIFVGEDHGGAVDDVVDGVMPSDIAHTRERRALFFAQHRIDLHHVDGERLIKRRQHPQRAKCVRHHGAAAGAEFDQPQQGRLADRAPHRGRPQAEQLAEHLADFRRGGEIALAPERIARDVIAVLRMQQAQLHVTPDRHRAGRLDQLLDLVLQRRKLGHYVP